MTPANRSLAWRRAASTLRLLAALALFQWMFLASECLERLADAGAVSGAAPAARDAAYAFAAEWRHGMAGGCPLYMPGFFATAAAVWFWARGRPARALLLEGGAALLLATAAAAVLAPYGAAWVVEAFERRTGFACGVGPYAPTALGGALGAYTLVTWASFIIAGQRALARMSLRPFWVPFALNAVLAVVRPVTVGDFTSLWWARALDGDPVAVLSLAAVPGLAAFFAWDQLAARGPAGGLMPARARRSPPRGRQGRTAS
jgi:hypothetical protein